jgi:hypothetical protein
MPAIRRSNRMRLSAGHPLFVFAGKRSGADVAPVGVPSARLSFSGPLHEIQLRRRPMRRGAAERRLRVVSQLKPKQHCRNYLQRATGPPS